MASLADEENGYLPITENGGGMFCICDGKVVSLVLSIYTNRVDGLAASRGILQEKNAMACLIGRDGTVV